VAIEVGQEAPDFTLPDESNNQVTLSELRGTPVVLMFYVFDFSANCTNELCEVRDDYQSWMDKGAKVFGISRDGRFSHAVFKEKENLPYSLLADTRGEVAKQYGVWNETALIAERATFVIDRDGKIAYAIHNPPANVRDHGDVEAHIK
jgi:mycoredoxin-dependent peroxiredoxin